MRLLRAHAYQLAYPPVHSYEKVRLDSIYTRANIYLYIYYPFSTYFPFFVVYPAQLIAYLARVEEHRTTVVMPSIIRTDSMNQALRTVVVLGASYAGYTGAQTLAALLPRDWRVVVIERNTHANRTS